MAYTNGNTENISMTGEWQKVAGPGNVTISSNGIEWAVKATDWTAVDALEGHPIGKECVSMLLATGQYLWVRGNYALNLSITADDFLGA